VKKNGVFPGVSPPEPRASSGFTGSSGFFP
jgi:hypothetical protein